MYYRLCYWYFSFVTLTILPCFLSALFVESVTPKVACITCDALDITWTPSYLFSAASGTPDYIPRDSRLSYYRTGTQVELTLILLIPFAVGSSYSSRGEGVIDIVLQRMCLAPEAAGGI